MLSIITAIHNCLAINRLYWKCLSENTTTPFELIIVDNHSTDGSEEFFNALSKSDSRVVYVRNEQNQSYPASQNQGIRHSRHDVLCFLNNDLWLPKGWELPFVRELKSNTLLVLSPVGQDAQPRQSISNKLKRKWKHITWMSFAWKKLLRRSEEERLWKSLGWMYGSLEKFSPPTRPIDQGFFNGIKGDSVVFHRDLLKRVPSVWDERFQAADWHLYLTLANEHEKDPSVPLPRVLLDAYTHHFGRYSARQKFEPLPPSVKFLEVSDFWDSDTLKRLWWGNYLPQ